MNQELVLDSLNPLVIFVSIFLAVSVDKLSEVKEARKDISLRTEQQQEMRKERREQLDALKNTEDSSSISNTLYRLVRFYSVSQKRQQDHQQLQLKKQRHRKDRKRSLPLDNMRRKSAEERRQSFQKSSSAPEQGGVSLRLDDEEDEGREIPSELTCSADAASSQYPTVVLLSMKNPLTKFQQSFAEAEQRHKAVKRISSIKSTCSTDNTLSTRPSLSSMSSSVCGWTLEGSLPESPSDVNTGFRELPGNPQRSISIQSEPPECLLIPTQMQFDYLRTQSLPVCFHDSQTKSCDDSAPSTPPTMVKFGAGAIEEEDEHIEQEYEECSQKNSVNSARLALVVPPNDSNSFARLERQSSLETIQPVGVVVDGEQQREERGASRVSKNLNLICRCIDNDAVHLCYRWLSLGTRLRPEVRNLSLLFYCQIM